MSFVHLHTHSHYSLLDGLSKIDKLVKRAAELSMPALALTDHGSLYGAIEFYHACHDAGIKPIIGMESYIAPRSMEDREGRSDSDYFHLTLLAMSYEGYLNLIKLSSESHLRGFYYKPRLDKPTLKKYSQGLIALSGCPRGDIPRAITANNPEMARVRLEEYLEIFGRDNFFIEIQRTERDENTPDARKFADMTRGLILLAKQSGVGLVATQDSHYIYPDDAEAQDVMVCIGTGRTVDSDGRLDMRSSDLSLRSPGEMKQLFADVPEALENTLAIAERCEVEIPYNQRYFAKVDIPAGETNESYLRKVAYIGAEKRFGVPLSEAVINRLENELGIICQKGYAPYFLMVENIAKGVRSLGAILTTRGSAAGSMVGYVLGITTIDPLEYQLPFERFLNPFRPTPPDFDLDISDSDRDRAIAWITEQYGKDKVAQVITFGTMQARAAVRDVGRALGISYGKCDRLAKLIPLGKQGFPMTLERAIDITPELKSAVEIDPEARQIIEIAKKLEGCARHASIHAAAVVITPTPLTDYTPLQREPGGERIITQYDMYSVDVGADDRALGVIKTDLLGIRNLSILSNAVKMVKKRHGVDIDIYNLPHPDPKTFTLLSRGHTFGVFQLGGGGMTKHLKDLKPSSIFDISAMVALYRPGPMAIIPEFISRKHNPSLVAYFDPRMKDYLERSRGLLVYQDDVLLTAINIAGYTWEEADKLRKAMGKKIPAEMAKQKEKFLSGCVKNGMSQEKAEELFALIEPFAAYGFNKSHAASYAQVAYQTAYVKAHYPVEFMASLMSAESGDEAKIYEAVEECKALGINVLPPDVMESFEDFTVVDQKTIRFGLNAIKNLGSDLVTHILRERAKGIGYTAKSTDQDARTGPNLNEFIEMCAPCRGFNKKSWEALVKGGALDRFGDRSQLLAGTEAVLAFAKNIEQDSKAKQDSLFGGTVFAKLKMPAYFPLSRREILAMEKEHLGLYVTAHPLDSYKRSLANVSKIKDLISNVSDNGQLVAGGLITRLKRTLTKKQEQMAVFTLEDPSGSVEVVVFPKKLPEVVENLANDRAVKITGRALREGEDELKIALESAADLVADADLHELIIYLQNDPSHDTFWQIKQTLEQFPGLSEVVVVVKNNGEIKRVKTHTKVTVTEALESALKRIVGVERVEA